MMKKSHDAQLIKTFYKAKNDFLSVCAIEEALALTSSFLDSLGRIVSKAHRWASCRLSKYAIKRGR